MKVLLDDVNHDATTMLRTCDLVRIAKQHVEIKKESQERPCVRCGGSGIYSKFHGECFRCGGSGIDPTNETFHFVVGGDVESLNKALQAAADKAQAKADQEAQECKKAAVEANKVRKAAEERFSAGLEALLAGIEDIVSALHNSPKNFAHSLAESLENGQGVYGRGVYFAAELAAKQILGKSRACKAVNEKAAELQERLRNFNNKLALLREPA